MRTAVAAFLAAFLLSGPAPAPAAEPASAEQLARLLMPKATWSRGMEQLAQSIEARMRMHPGAQLEYPADFGEKARKEVEQVLPYDDLVGMHAKELAAAYSPAELEGLVAFYKGPLGQKSLEKMPQVSENVAVATQQRVESKMPDVMKRLSALAKPPAGSPGKAAPKAAPPTAKGGAK